MTTARRHAAWSGLAATALFGIGSAIWGLDMPSAGTPVGEVLAFYDETADRIVAGATLSLVGIAAFVWFAAALRQVLAEEGAEDFLVTAAFGGAIAAAATGLGAETINMSAALRARDDELSGDLAKALFETSQMFGSVASAIGLGVFAIGTGVAALRTGRVLPRALAVATLIAGVVLLSPLSHLNWLPGGLLVLLGLSISVALLRRPVV